MTLPVDAQEFDSFVPVFSTSPEKPEDMRNFTTEQLRIHATNINVREIGWMLDQELLTGKSFIPGTTSPQQEPGFRSVFRKVVIFGTLPNTATKSVAHGITFDANFTLVDLWASATDPVGFTAFTADFGGTAVTLNMDATNVNITTNADYTAYTRCFVVIEYLLEQ
jgi:hypothetical protein